MLANAQSGMGGKRRITLSNSWGCSFGLKPSIRAIMRVRRMASVGSHTWSSGFHPPEKAAPPWHSSSHAPFSPRRIPVSSMKFSSRGILSSLLWQDHFECCVPSAPGQGWPCLLPRSRFPGCTNISATHGNNNTNSPGSRWGKTTQLLQNLCLKRAPLKREVNNLWWLLADPGNDFQWMEKKRPFISLLL